MALPLLHIPDLWRIWYILQTREEEKCSVCRKLMISPHWRSHRRTQCRWISPQVISMIECRFNYSTDSICGRSQLIKSTAWMGGGHCIGWMHELLGTSTEPLKRLCAHKLEMQQRRRHWSHPHPTLHTQTLKFMGDSDVIEAGRNKASKLSGYRIHTYSNSTCYVSQFL